MFNSLWPSDTIWRQIWVNSLAPGKFEWNSWHVIFIQILVIDGWGISCEIALIWMSLDFADDQSTLVQVIAWCRRAAVRQQAITWGHVDPDLCRHMALLGHSELTLVWVITCLMTPSRYLNQCWLLNRRSCGIIIRSQRVSARMQIHC